MKELTKQDIFNQVYLGLKRQGFQRSRVDKPGHGQTCAYRGAAGRKCAIGHLISDEEYNPKMEGLDVYGLVKNNWLPKRFERFSEFLKNLQVVHDCNETDYFMRNDLKIFAENNNLTIPEE